MNGRTKLLAGLIALLVTATLVAAVMLSVHYERNEREEALVRATDAAVTGIRARLRDSEQSLLVLAAELGRTGDEAAVFERTVGELLANTPALLRVELRDEAGALRRAASAPAPRPRLDDSRGNVGFETALALRSALDLSLIHI